jgi:hypothetical protein
MIGRPVRPGDELRPDGSKSIPSFPTIYIYLLDFGAALLYIPFF